MIPVAVAMPLYNEADGIGRTLSELDTALHERGYVAEFFIQNDCSSDNSFDVVRTHLLHEQGRVQLATNETNLGHGPSVMRAYSRALASNHDLVVHLDSDGEVDARSVVGCLDRLRQERCDALIGLRQGREGPLYRRIVTRLLRVATLVVFGVSSPDVNSPIRVYKHSCFRQWLACCPDNPVAPHVLLTVLTHKSGIPFTYHPVKMVALQEISTGSTWRTSKRVLGVPTRFIRLVSKALSELLAFRFRTLKGRTQCR